MIEMSKEDAKKKLLKKHPALTPEEVEKKKREIKEAREEREAKMATYEKNLMGYFKKTEQLKDENGTILALIRYPSYTELTTLIPEDIEKLTEMPKDVKKEQVEKYVDTQFELMATLIVEPEKKAEWWKTNSSLAFLNLFNDKLGEMLKVATEEAKDFPLARKGKP